MRSCEINGCNTKSSNAERSLFAVNGEDRQKWIPVIAAHQSLKNGKMIYICDLHFDQNDLVKNGKHLRPKQNVLPRIGGSDSNQFNEDAEVDTDLQPADFESNTSENMKFISVQEYCRLVQSGIDLIKANETIRRLNMLIQQKNTTIVSLENQLSVKTENSHLSPEQNEVLSHLQHRNKNDRTKYPPAVRKFCLRTQFHSTSAYNEIRKFFGNRLPSVRTIQRWLRSADASPGITTLALDIIEHKVHSYKDQGTELHLCLISDEMSIRKQITYKPEHKKFCGFASVSNSSKKDSNPELSVAKDALVFMAVGPDFRIAVAYFLLNGLESIDRAALTREVIRSVHGTGAKIISLTSDGLRANIVVAQLIGADFKADKPFFVDPYKPAHRIYIIFDPAHMLKLVRKYFAERQLYHNGNKLQWKLLEILARKQDSDNFELGNKLSHRHINYETAKMDVRLAVETFSNSVADALQQLDEDGYEDFIGCDASIEFIRLMNNLFDVTNYGEGKKTDDRFKQPISDSTIDSVRDLFNKGREFIKQITIEQSSASKKEKKNRIIPVLQSRSSMGFFGIMQNITSTIGIYEDYVRGGSLDVFYPFQYSQDHLETYFSLVRSCGGANNNPNEEQFCAAYRKLLFCVPHLSARGSNCNLDVTNVLSVSSAHPPVLSSGNSISAEIGTEIEIGMSYDDVLNVPLEPYEQHMCAYLAANVETKMIRNIKARTKAACQDCSKVFEENPKIFDTFIARKNMAQPCSSTRDLIVVSNSVINLLKMNEHIGFQTIAKSISGILNMDRLYESSQFNDHHLAERKINCTNMTHKEQFIDAIVEEYMHMKSTKIGKRITIEEQGSSIRKKSTRNVILAGQ